MGIYTHEDLGGRAPRLAEPLPVLIPHPALTTPNRVRPGQRTSSITSASPSSWWSPRPLSRRGCRRPDRRRYEVLPAVVGIPAAPRGRTRRARGHPGNVAAHLIQQVGDADAAIARSAPAGLDLASSGRSRCRWRAGGSCALGSRRREPAGVFVNPGGDLGARRDSRQARSAAAEGGGASPPTSGAGSVSRSCTRGRRRSSCRWRRCAGPRPVKWTEDRREHFVSAAHERGQQQHITSDSTTAGRFSRST